MANKYERLESKIDKIDIYDISDTEYIVLLMLKSISRILSQTKELLDDKKSTFVFPLLRQAFEYEIFILGLCESLISVEEFMDVNEKEKRLFAKTISKLEEKLAPNDDDFEQIFALSLIKSLKKILDKHTHASIERLVRFVSETNSEINILNILTTDARMVKCLIESLFSNMLKSILNHNFYVNTPPKNKVDYKSYFEHSFKDDDRLKKIPSYIEKMDNHSRIINEGFSFIKENKDIFEPIFNKVYIKVMRMKYPKKNTK